MIMIIELSNNDNSVHPLLPKVWWRTDLNVSECLNEQTNSRLITLPEGEL
jgi:hypothetical protein